MAIRTGDVYGTFRCPVCGHRDATELDNSDASRVVECSYCQTSLEVYGRGPASARFSVQVASESVQG
jgi:transcription elongation factor Elf1